ncbi:fungal-specific transcription factor domain-containing protein [Exophiala viscosa]|uniref:Fungal-specific transcription factor domain-containing protein n=1 Tax=Exophiala viscosa TaxID=2486360 RepID=A0AAN6IF51_9EURO|nr:fungal-specific transcription factor domain-containing protein [Exophiala viscosa]KAI1621792.1 fungal-specific transcription factor domain-containing protein [Exophiala viscosa]
MSGEPCVQQPVTVSASTRRRNLAGKRTNSLGWASTDCHTCAGHRYCDRRRPRCSACLADGVVCGGYVQSLNWDRGKVRVERPRSESTSKKPKKRPSNTQASPLPQPSAFVFVDQSEPSERSKKRARKNSSFSDLSTVNASPRGSVGRGSISTASDSMSSTLSDSSQNLKSIATTPEPSSAQSMVISLSPHIRRHPGDLEDALSFYHSTFSYTTLTFPVSVNPWHAALNSIHDDIPCVRYAAIALAQRQQAHLRNKREGLAVLDLKAKALSIFATHLGDLSVESGISTSLLLVALDFAMSGFENWAIHLRGAFQILESNGGIRLAESRQTLRSQTVMLIWYDVNAALLSRRRPIFPRYYLETLMIWQSDTEWSILGLNGLPDRMFLDMYDLAVAAAQPECCTSEMTSAFEARILNSETKDQENTQIVSMSIVWKLGLLLYCRRALSSGVSPDLSDTTTPTPNDADSPLNFDLHTPHSLACEILNIVADLPPDSNFQKQCLLPIALAGAEATNRHYRRIAEEYCDRWKERTGMWIFDSVMAFMTGVWARNDSDITVSELQGDGDDDSSVSPCDIGTRSITVPWTEIYPRGVEYGFLFG